MLPQQLLTDGAKRVIKRPPAGRSGVCLLHIKKQLPAAFSSSISTAGLTMGEKIKTPGGKEE